MKLSNLKNGDSFMHHEYGRSTVVSINDRASLCKSEKNPSFLVDEDYEIKEPIFNTATLQQVQNFFNLCSEEEIEQVLSDYEIRVKATKQGVIDYIDNASEEDLTNVLNGITE